MRKTLPPIKGISSYLEPSPGLSCGGVKRRITNVVRTDASTLDSLSTAEARVRFHVDEAEKHPSADVAVVEVQLDRNSGVNRR